MLKRIAWSCGICCATFILVAPSLRAQTPPPASAVLYACVPMDPDADQGKVMRMVAATEACRPRETRIQWNVIGPQGAQGVPGPQGLPGVAGPAGAQGIQGATGPAGLAGTQGSKGDPGAQGVQGIAGPTGPAGPNGDSVRASTTPYGADPSDACPSQSGRAFELVDGNGAVVLGSRAIICNGAAGAAGVPGLPGLNGATGATGAQGSAGSNGSKGDTGAAGQQGPQGIAGPQGPTGAPGPQGPAGGDTSTLQSQISTLQSQVSALQTQLAAVLKNPALLLGPYVSVDQDAQRGLKGPNISFTGANVHILSGTGATLDTTGLGNLVIGYNWDNADPRVVDPNRTGSHNLVLGDNNMFTSSGGLVAGALNLIWSPYSTVTGGECNAAGANIPNHTAVVPSFSDNVCQTVPQVNEAASVNGGLSNTASGGFSSVSGGQSNTASGLWASVSAGQSNTASGYDASVTGGSTNSASGPGSSVTGGAGNTATGTDASVTGGFTNSASGNISSVTGGENNGANASSSSVAGGSTNYANGQASSVGGGSHQTVSSDFQNVN